MLIQVDQEHADYKMSDLEGLDHDRCPHCSHDVEPTHRLPGGRVIYSDDPRKGGCGAAWSRTSKEGQAADASKGMKSKFLTTSARVNRAIFTPSEQFKTNYERIFGHS